MWIDDCKGALLLAPLTFAKPADENKDINQRLQNAGTVLHEILNIPDNIPQDHAG